MAQLSPSGPGARVMEETWGDFVLVDTRRAVSEGSSVRLCRGGQISSVYNRGVGVSSSSTNTAVFSVYQLLSLCLARPG